MKHSFDVEVAAKYGLLSAIVLQWMYNAMPWCEFRDGKHWVTSGTNAMAKVFPYVSSSTIGRTFTQLEKSGLIISGNFSEDPMNHTKWYALTSIGMALCKARTKSVPAKSNSDSDTMMVEFFDKVWSSYPKKKGKASMTKTKVTKLMKSVGADQLLRCIDRYLAEHRWHKGDEMTYLKDGSTFFNSGYVDYLDANYEEQETITYADEDKPKRQ